MPLQRVLWLVNANERSASTGPEPLPPGVGICRATSLDEALGAIRSEKIDCVLISAQTERRDRGAVLELFLEADVHVPVIFWDGDLSARQAIQLVREGAYTCHGGRDDWDAVLESITQACEEKQRREQTHVSAENAEPWRRKLVGNSPAMEDVANTIRLV